MMKRIPSGRDIGNEETEKLLAEIEKEVKLQYQIAKEELEEKLEILVDRYNKELENIMLNKSIEYISSKEFNAWKLSKIKQQAWFYDMIDVLSEDMTNANQIAMSIVNGYMPEVYAINGNFTTYSIEKQAKINTYFTMYNPQTVERLIKDKPELLPKATVNVPKDLQWNKNAINTAIIQGTLQGEGIKSIAERLVLVVGMNENVAIRNARTMVTAAQNMGREDAIKRANDMGIDTERAWVSTLDFRTRHSHRKLDGEIRPIGEPFSNGLMFPGDPDGAPAEVYNCRCREVATVYGFNPFLYAKNRQNKLGGMSYEDWKAGKSPKILQPTKKNPTAKQTKAKQTKKATAQKEPKKLSIKPKPQPTQNIEDSTPKKVIQKQAHNEEINASLSEKREKLNNSWQKNEESADKLLRPITSKVWIESKFEERDAAYSYTSGSGKFNRTLRNGELQTAPKVYVEEIHYLTEMINKSELPSITLTRGTTYHGSSEFLHVEEDRLRGKDKNLETELIGIRVKDEAFLSCGTVKGSGFGGGVKYNIYCPEGTKGLYAEPFSAFGEGDGYHWDGISGQDEFGGEFETILQRGTEFEVIRVDTESSRGIIVDLMVVSQDGV